METHKGGVSSEHAVRAATSYKDIVSALNEASNAASEAKKNIDVAMQNVRFQNFLRNLVILYLSNVS